MNRSEKLVKFVKHDNNKNINQLYNILKDMTIEELKGSIKINGKAFNLSVNLFNTINQRYVIFINNNRDNIINEGNIIDKITTLLIKVIQIGILEMSINFLSEIALILEQEKPTNSFEESCIKAINSNPDFRSMLKRILLEEEISEYQTYNEMYIIYSESVKSFIEENPEYK